MPPAIAQLKTDLQKRQSEGTAPIRAPTGLTKSGAMSILTGVGGSQAINKESDAKLL